MANPKGFWTDVRIAEMRQAVKEGIDGRLRLAEIAARLSTVWGVHITKDSLQKSMQKNAVAGSVGAPVPAPAPLEEEPVELPDTVPVMRAAAAVAMPVEDTAASLQEEHEERTEVVALRAAKKLLLEELRAAKGQIETLTELRKSHPLPPISHLERVGGHQRQGVPLIVLSDLHIEERVDPEKVNGLNKYNPAIADKCLTAAFDGFLWLAADPRFDVRTGVVAVIGDTFSGHIHEELVERNYMSPTLAALWLQGRLERELRRVAKETNWERIIVVMKDGNHGRLTHKIRCATRTDNSLEWMMFQTIAARMSDDARFEFIVEEGIFTYLDVYNTGLCFAHGDIWRSAGGVGGITIPLRKGFNERKKYPRKMDHMILGHFHNYLDIGEIIVNGSMIGVTPYSLANSFAPEPRRQAFMMIDSERGKCISAPVWLPQYDPSRD